MTPNRPPVGCVVHIPPMKFSAKRCSLVPQLCYTVFMGNTVHITVRLPIDTVARVDAEAKRLNRSRSWVIAWILSDVELFHKEAVYGQQDQMRAMPVAVQPKERKAAAASRREVVPAKAQPNNCPSCGALNGIHQRGCKG